MSETSQPNIRHTLVQIKKYQITTFFFISLFIYLIVLRELIRFNYTFIILHSDFTDLLMTALTNTLQDYSGPVDAHQNNQQISNLSFDKTGNKLEIFLKFFFDFINTINCLS